MQGRQQRRNGSTEYSTDNREEMVAQNIVQAAEKKWLKYRAWKKGSCEYHILIREGEEIRYSYTTTQ